MPIPSSQDFLREFDKKLWPAADFFPGPAHDRELEERDDDIEINVFREPALRSGDTPVANRTRVATGVSPHPHLAGPAPAKPLGDDALTDLIATIPFQPATCPGTVKRRRTPKSIVSLIVEMIEPYQGRVYDPTMGSGGFFVQSERFIEEHGGTIGDIMVFGQESNPTTWRLAAMNMAKSLPRHSETATGGIDIDFGREPADTFTRDPAPGPPRRLRDGEPAHQSRMVRDQLRLSPAHAPPPRAEWLDEFEFQRRGRKNGPRRGA